MKQLFSLFVLGLLFFSCAENNELPESPSAGESIQTRIRLSVSEAMQIGDGTSTRGVGSENEALEVQLGGGQTRAEVDVPKTEAEKAIKKAWLLQFDGVATTSKLVAAPQALTPGADGYADCQLVGNNANNRMYVIANVDEATVNKLTTATMLVEFEKTLFPQGAMSPDDVATKGLPMSAFQDFNPSTTPPSPFSLSSRMAKLTFQYALATQMADKPFVVTLRGIPSGVVGKSVAPVAASQQPAGATYAGTYSLTDASKNAMTVYVPENLAGQNTTITKEVDRSITNAMLNGMYIELSSELETANRLDLCAYSVYLGNLTEHKGDFNVKGNTAYEVMVNIKGTNALDKRVIAGTYLNLSQDADGKPATANCYVVPANVAGNFCINASVAGNGKQVLKGTAANATDVPAYADELVWEPGTAEVLWETNAIGEVVTDVKLYKGKLLFKTNNSNRAGNAVIAVKNAFRVLWSWHIWKTDEISTVKVTDGTREYALMDRDLGAVGMAYTGAYGLYYQWGRKDPFPCREDIISVPLPPVRGRAPVDYTTENPTTFLAPGPDWIDERNDNLWGAPIQGEVGQKTVYDPCPIGWRVAPRAAFQTAKRSDSQMRDGCYLFGSVYGMPDPFVIGNIQLEMSIGGRLKDDIRLEGRGTMGVWHSVGASGEGTAQCLILTGGLDGTLVDVELGSQNRYLGANVRCVAE